MDDYQHPLEIAEPPQELNTMALDTNEPTTDSKTLRGRSKSVALGSYAWTLNPPRLPIDYTAPPQTSVPFKARSWEPTLETAIKAIVSIKASHVRSFDTETSGKLILAFFFFKKKDCCLHCSIRWLYSNGIYCGC